MPQLETWREKRDYFWSQPTAMRAGDYAYAKARVKRPIQGRHLERGYEVARHFAQTILARRKAGARSLELLFNEIAERWRTETRHWSSITKMISHPAYLRIIGLASQFPRRDVERCLLLELRNQPDYWFAALTAITGEDPVQPQHDFDEAVNAWLEWGRRKGIV